jgi:hypothetical protein
LDKLNKRPKTPISNTVKFVREHTEFFALALLFLCAWIFFYKTGSGPVSWDELLYMDRGLNPIADGHILNRWMHIYWQKLFLDLAPSPIQGAKLFWGFLMAGTLVLVYQCAKIIGKESGIANGIIAMLFLGSSSSLFLFAGVTYSDYTVMFLVTFGLYIYLLYLRQPRHQVGLLILFGFILFVATKSKETGVILVFLIPGFAFVNNQYNPKHFIRNFRYLFLGIGIGFMVLALLDYVYLHNAFISLSPAYLSEWSAFTLNTNSLEGGVKTRVYYWIVKFSQLFSEDGQQWVDRVVFLMPVLSFLYIINSAILAMSFKSKRSKPWPEVFIWCLPIAFVGILILAGGSKVDRYLYPMFPVIAILGSQFFEAKLPRKKTVLKKIWGIVSDPWLIAGFFALSVYAITQFGLGLKVIYYEFVPFLGFLLIAIALWVRRWTVPLSILAILVAIVYSFYGIFYTTLLPLASGHTDAESQARFEPLAEIVGAFDCKSDTTIYISAHVRSDLHLLSRSTSSSPWIFNVYFDCGLNESQTIYATDPQLPTDITVSKHYTYAFLTSLELKALSPNQQAEIEKAYSIQYISDRQIAFLIYKSE